MALDFTLTQVKNLIGVDNPQIDIIFDMVSNRLLNMINAQLQGIKEPLEVIPNELEYVVGEVTIVRYNKLGSEGLSSESVEGHSATYINNDDFKPYLADINSYINAQTPKSEGVIRFI